LTHNPVSIHTHTAAAAEHEPAHRVLPPLSKGWAYGGPAGSRKEEVDSQPQEGDKAPLSKGWAYGGPAGSRKEEVDVQGQQEGDKAEAKPAN
jgi:hypothetical protein